MKVLTSLAFLLSLSAYSGTITLSEYNYSIGDVAEMGLNKDDLFSKMNKSLVRTKDSICSNRAHVWAYDLKKQNIDSVKVFMFLTPKTSYFEGASWWYHVSPAINENGKLYVMDAGFPKRVKGPLLVKDWLKEFNGKDSVCKEIKTDDEALVRLMFGNSAFPETTPSGKFNCYYRITPAGYWVPSQVATNILGKNEQGSEVILVRDTFEDSEVYQACREASTSPMGYAMGRGGARCRDFIEGNHILTSEY